MISIRHFKTSQAAKDYHGHLDKGDSKEYHGKEAGRHAPVYEGKTADMLGIEGQRADKESWYKLCDNEHPLTGEKLTLRNKDNRRIMADFTFDAPKSVSLAAVVDERIRDAMIASIDETMRDAQEQMAVRVRKDGKDENRLTRNALWVKWEHETSRPAKDGTTDPHKHFHVTVMNISYDSVEGVYKASQLGDIVRDKAKLQADYHARLASRLSAIGYGIEVDGNSFKLKGISRDLVDKFSRRHAAINEVAEANGITDPEERARLAKTTRNRKSEELNLDELRPQWLERMTPDEIASLKAAGSGKYKTDRITPAEAVQYALDHSFERSSTMPEKKLKAVALNYAVGSVLPEDVDRALASHPDVIKVKLDGQAMVTTHTMLNMESADRDFARAGHGKYGPLGKVEDLPDTLSAEQGAAAAKLLQSRDRITGLIGKAGTGKTYTIKRVVEAMEKSGQHVHLFAPSAQASRGVLRKEGFEKAETLEKFLTDERMQRECRGGVLWVDEAGMVGTRSMHRLFKVADRNGCRVVLSGDYAQHGAIEAGSPFRMLETAAGVHYARLNRIRRQSDAEYRSAVELLSSGQSGKVKRGFDMLDQKGWIVEADHEERHPLLIKDYLQAANEGKTALIIAPTHAEGDKLTAELREAMNLGESHIMVSRKATQWTEPQRGDGRNYEPGMIVEWTQNVKGGFKRGEAGVVTAVDGRNVTLLRPNGKQVALPLEHRADFQAYRPKPIAVAVGDRIRITKNSKALKVNNGDILPVERFTDKGDIVAGGRVIPKTFGHIAYGYVDTSIGAQGKDVDRVFIAAGDASVLAVNAQQFYVSMSRAKEMSKMYVESKAEMRDAIARTGKQLSALELVKNGEPLNERMQINRAIDYRERQGQYREPSRERGRGHG